MKPESEWFRPPKLIHVAVPIGDYKCYLWVAEPELHSISGVGYKIGATQQALFGDDAIDAIHKAAKVELYRRIEAGITVPEGSNFDAFEWFPVTTREEDGSITVSTLEPDVVNIVLTPVYRARASELDAKNLYSRPGRFISVSGNPAECCERPLVKGPLDEPSTEAGGPAPNAQ